MGKSRLVSILACILLLFSLSYTTAFSSFSDDFNGDSVDTNKWTVFENNGQITVSNSILHINQQSGQSYPYMHSGEIFSGGNFSLEVKVKLEGPLSYGFGVNITDRILTNQTTQDLGWGDLVYLVWPDGSGHFNLYTVSCPVAQISCVDDQYNNSISSNQLGEWVVYKFERIGQEVNVYKNGSLINTLRVGTKLPRYIWIGNPQKTSSVTRGNIDIDYIRLEEVASTAASTTPVIIVPGFGASWNYQSILTNTDGGDWFIPEWVNTYQNIIDSFHNTGYLTNQDLFTYTYDWRKDLDHQADSLNTYVEDLKTQGKITNDAKIDFVAHSFGGLVARSYLDKYGTANLNKLITAGSPHEGAAAAYKAWSGAQVLLGNWWQKSALSLLLGLNGIKGESPITAIRRLSPSIQNILPTYDFLQDSGGALKPYTQMSAQNSYLSTLNSNILSIDASTSAIGGNHNSTLDKIVYEPRNWLDQLLGKWEDGKPLTDVYTDLADGTVTQQSAFGGFTNTEILDMNHGGLVFDGSGIALIFQKLGIDTSKIVATRSATQGKDPIVSILRSPGNLKLLTPSGVLVGMGEPSTSSAIVIPEEKMLIIPSPEPGDYRVLVTSDGETGDYSLFAGYSSSLGLELNRIDATLGINDTDAFFINQNTSLSSVEPSTTQDFEEIINETVNRLDPDIEVNILVKNRIQNIKAYIQNRFSNFPTKTLLSQRNIILDAIRQLSTIKNNTNMVNANQVILDDLLTLLMSQSQKNLTSESIDTSLYDLLYLKNASGEATLQEQPISTSSGTLLSPLFGIVIPTASQSGDILSDLSKMYLKSAFLY